MPLDSSPCLCSSQSSCTSPSEYCGDRTGYSYEEIRREIQQLHRTLRTEGAKLANMSRHFHALRNALMDGVRPLHRAVEEHHNEYHRLFSFATCTIEACGTLKEMMAAQRSTR